MKAPLTARSAAACENATSPASACKCRCGGAMHGSARGPVRELAAGDPHLPDDESPKQRKERERAEAWDALKRDWAPQPSPLPEKLEIGTRICVEDDVALTAPELKMYHGELVYWARWGTPGELTPLGFYRPADIDWKHWRNSKS